jgi:hypothetical protein
MVKYIFVLTLVLTISKINAQVTLFNVDFQNGIPSNFSIINNDGLTPAPAVSEYTSAWISTIDPSNVTDSIASSTSFFSPVGTANRWLITPKVKLGSFGNFIEWNARSQDASFPDDYLVLVSRTTPSIAAFQDTIAKLSAEYVDWTTRTVDLSLKGFNDDSVYVAFVNKTNNGYKLYIDDIRIWKEDPASLFEVTNVNTVDVFPNPSTDYVKISTIDSFISATIYSLNGQEILTSTDQKIAVHAIENGVYFISIATSKGVASVRFVKN